MARWSAVIALAFHSRPWSRPFPGSPCTFTLESYYHDEMDTVMNGGFTQQGLFFFLHTHAMVSWNWLLKAVMDGLAVAGILQV